MSVTVRLSYLILYGCTPLEDTLQSGRDKDPTGRHLKETLLFAERRTYRQILRIVLTKRNFIIFGWQPQFYGEDACQKRPCTSHPCNAP